MTSSSKRCQRVRIKTKRKRIGKNTISCNSHFYVWNFIEIYEVEKQCTVVANIYVVFFDRVTISLLIWKTLRIAITNRCVAFYGRVNQFVVISYTQTLCGLKCISRVLLSNSITSWDKWHHLDIWLIRFYERINLSPLYLKV